MPVAPMLPAAAAAEELLHGASKERDLQIRAGAWNLPWCAAAHAQPNARDCARPGKNMPHADGREGSAAQHPATDAL